MKRSYVTPKVEKLEFTETEEILTSGIDDITEEEEDDTTIITTDITNNGKKCKTNHGDNGHQVGCSKHRYY